MKAVLYYGKEDIRVEEIDEPEVRPGTLKIKPAYNGICGSDLHLYHEGPISPAPTETDAHPISGETLPVVLGHEFSGTVEEVGEGVTGVEPGDRVAVEPLMVDGTCAACQIGKYNLCEKMGFIGISGLGGGLSERIVVEERWVHPVGDIPLDEAALIEPLSVAVHAVRHAGYDNAQTAVIGGAGPIGLLTAAVLRAYGIRTVVSEIADSRREKAISVGVADVTVNPAREDLYEVVMHETDRKGADLVFDASGVSVVVDQLLDVLAPGGRAEIIALHTQPYELDIVGKLTMQDRVLGSSIGYANDHTEAIRLVSEGLVDLAPLITSKITAEDIVQDGFEKLMSSRSEVKILVSMS